MISVDRREAGHRYQYFCRISGLSLTQNRFDLTPSQQATFLKLWNGIYTPEDPEQQAWLEQVARPHIQQALDKEAKESDEIQRRPGQGWDRFTEHYDGRLSDDQ